MGEPAVGGRRGARRVLFLSWRDLGNPLGGGAERYLHRLATGLAARGDVVSVRTARYPGAAARELVDGVRYLRCGNADTVFPTTLRDLATGRLGRPDVVVDCQNGIPFFSRAVTRSPVVVLVHHVHREQWRVAVGPVAARVGWWLESSVAPPFYRGCRYVAVSPTTRRELIELRRAGRPDQRRAQRRRRAAAATSGTLGHAVAGRAQPAGPAQAGGTRARGARPAGRDLAGVDAHRGRRRLLGRAGADPRGSAEGGRPGPARRARGRRDRSTGSSRPPGCT